MNLQIYDWLIIAAIPLIAYQIAVRTKKNVLKREDDSEPIPWRGYYLANGMSSPLGVGAAFVGANLTFTSIFLIITEESYKRGLWTLCMPIFWAIGTVLLLWLYPKMKKFTSNGMTLHQAIGSTFKDKRLQASASLWTVIAFVLTVALEFYGGIRLMRVANVPALHNVAIAIILAVIVTAFTAKGGFRGISNSDKFLDGVLLLGTIVLGLGLFEFGSKLLLFNPSISNLVIGVPPPILSDNITFVIGMALILIPFQLCTLDSWQRIAAAEKSQKSPKKFLIIGTIILCAAYLVPVFIGIKMREMGILVPKGSFVLFQYLEYLHISPGVIGVVIAGFISAIFATSDELLNCCSLSFLFDFMNAPREMTENKVQTAKINASGKFYTGLAGFIAAVFAIVFAQISSNLHKDISDLAVAVFSGQIVFILPLYFVFFNPSKAPSYAKTIWIAMIVSFFISIGAVLYGWVQKDADISDGAPLFGFTTALIILIVVSLYRFSRKLLAKKQV